jgi:hypothetical protein
VNASLANPVGVVATLSEQALHALVVHRMLTAEQLRELLSPDSAALTNWSARLNVLARNGLIRSLPCRGARSRKVWCATRDGLRIAAGAGPRSRLYEVPAGGGILQAHTLALNNIGLAFVRAARARGDDCDAWSWEHEIAHTMGSAQARSTLIADAVLTYGRVAAGGAADIVLRRFLELDRATEPVARLAEKIRSYAAYHRWVPNNPAAHGLAAGQPAWEARYHRWPVLCIVIGANPAKGPKAIERRIDALIELAGHDTLVHNEGIGVLIGAYADIVARGPWAPVWWRLDAPEIPVDMAGEIPSSGPIGR